MIRTEAWIANRLSAPDLFVGITTPVDRRERVRTHLVAHELDHAIAGSRGGKAETWADLFQRVYSQPLRGKP